MLPDFYVAPHLESGKLKRILAAFPLPELGIYAVYPQRAHVPPKVRAFVDFLSGALGAAGPRKATRRPARK